MLRRHPDRWDKIGCQQACQNQRIFLVGFHSCAGNLFHLDRIGHQYFRHQRFQQIVYVLSIGGGFDHHPICFQEMLWKPILQICVLHPAHFHHFFPVPINSPNHRIILVNVQCNISTGTCFSTFFHATLSLNLGLGRGFLPALCRRHMWAVSGTHRFGFTRPTVPAVLAQADESPPGDQVTTRAFRSPIGCFGPP